MLEMCAAKTRLLVAYETAALKYAKSVAEVCQHAGTIPEMQHKQLTMVAARAREVCTAAKEALQAHLAEHHCS